ncbi:MAG: hypothetical protein II685_05585, partial [Clostridia bacterium]|nr:hypothetical protein [Clostridia bacterium]
HSLSIAAIATSVAPPAFYIAEMTFPEGMILERGGFENLPVRSWKTDNSEVPASNNTGNELIPCVKNLVKNCSYSYNKNSDFFSNGYEYLYVVVRDCAVMQLKDPDSDFGITLSVADVINRVSINSYGLIASEIMPSTVFLAETFCTKEDETGKYLSAAYGENQNPLKQRSYIIQKRGSCRVPAGNLLNDGSVFDTKLEIVFFNELNYSEYFDRVLFNFYYGNNDFPEETDTSVKEISERYDANLQKGIVDYLSATGRQESSTADRWILPALIGFCAGVLVFIVPTVIVFAVRKKKKHV